MRYLMLAAVLAGMSLFMLLAPAKTKAAKCEKQEAQPRKRKGPNPITMLSLRVLRVPLGVFRIFSVLSAAGMVLGWLLLTHNPIASALMGFVGWGLPGFVMEVAATEQMSAMARQTSLFIATTADGLQAGKQIDGAVQGACRAVAMALPLGPLFATALGKMLADMPPEKAIQEVAEQTGSAVLRFYAQLAKEAARSGGHADVFRQLDYVVQEEESITHEVQGKIAPYLLFMLGLVVLNVGASVGDYLGSGALMAQYKFLAMAGALGAVVLFTAMRNYSRLRVTVGSQEV